MNITADLRREAVRARDEHGNTDFYELLVRAAGEIEFRDRALQTINRVASPNQNRTWDTLLRDLNIIVDTARHAMSRGDT